MVKEVVRRTKMREYDDEQKGDFMKGLADSFAECNKTGDGLLDYE